VNDLTRLSVAASVEIKCTEEARNMDFTRFNLMVSLILIHGPLRNRAEQNVQESSTRFVPIQSQNCVFYAPNPRF
jgi:hypothetical protein